MSDLDGFVDILLNSMNNPDCSFWIGMTFGQMLAVRLVIILLIAFVIIKVIDKLILNPLLRIIEIKIDKMFRNKFSKGLFRK